MKNFKNLDKKLFRTFNEVSIFINHVCKKGYKLKSYNIMLYLLKTLKRRFKKTPSLVFVKSIINAKIMVRIYNKKRGSQLYKIPLFLTNQKQIKKGILNLVKLVSEMKKEHILKKKLSLELINLYFYKGVCINYKKNLYKSVIEYKQNLKYIKIRKKKKFLTEFLY